MNTNTALPFLFIIFMTYLVTLSYTAVDANDDPIYENNNECVILLHGLNRSSRSFSKMQSKLIEDGYHVVNVNYPSRKHTIEILANSYIPTAIEKCQAIDAQSIHFVTHSMGGILARYFLANNTVDQLGHVVMLSPPNQGSEVVDKLKDIPGFVEINGPAGQQLGTSIESLPNMLGPVEFPVGIITGNKSINLILSLLIPGDDDGKVSIKRAKIEGMTDFLVVSHTHPMIMLSDKVIRQTTYFIRHGRFYDMNSKRKASF